jgi:TRAP-type uncharacterized transport system substrate-binding protein
MPRKSPLSFSLRFGRAYIFALAAVAFMGWGLYSASKALRPPEDMHVRMGAGSAVARRVHIVESFATEARKRDLFIEAVSTKGFEDSIRQLAAGKLDIAGVSSGLEIAEGKNVRVLAGLDIAPLHILIRRELANQGLSLVESIKGRRVNLGQPGTNDYMLANEIVRFLRLSPIDSSNAGDFFELTLTKEQLSQLATDIQSQTGSGRQALVRELPDVVMTVASLPGMLVQNLIDTGEYSLAPFPHVESFLLSNLQSKAPEGGVDHILVEATEIHAGMYVGNTPVPMFGCPTVGLRTLLVARADLPSPIVKRVMECGFETDFMRRVKPLSPRAISTPYEIHPAAEAYLDRDKPLITGTFFEMLSKFLSIFGAFSAGALSIYGYLRKRRIRRPGEYLDEIRKIDALATGKECDGDAPLVPGALAQQLDARLTQLKEQIISDYCNNRVQGEMVLLSILSILADSRTQLRAPPGRSVEDQSPFLADTTSSLQTVGPGPAPPQRPGRNPGLAA